MTTSKVTGLAALQERLAAEIDVPALKERLHREAEAIAAEARTHAPASLAQSIEVLDVSRGTSIAYAIGVPGPGGPALEFGTLRKGSSPWLLPAFPARRSVVNDVLRNAVQAAFRRLAGAF